MARERLFFYFILFYSSGVLTAVPFKWKEQIKGV